MEFSEEKRRKWVWVSFKFEVSGERREGETSRLLVWGGKPKPRNHR